MRYNRRKFTKGYQYRGGSNAFEFFQDFGDFDDGATLGVTAAGGSALWIDSTTYGPGTPEGFRIVGSQLRTTGGVAFDNDGHATAEPAGGPLGFDFQKPYSFAVDVTMIKNNSVNDPFYLFLYGASGTPPTGESAEQISVRIGVTSNLADIRRKVFLDGNSELQVESTDVLSWALGATKRIRVELGANGSARTFDVYADDVLITSDTFDCTAAVDERRRCLIYHSGPTSVTAPDDPRWGFADFEVLGTKG